MYRKTSKYRRISKAFRRQNPTCSRCPQTTDLQIHHLKSVKRGGDPFAWDNLVMLCRTCHKHEDAWEDATFPRSSVYYEERWIRREPDTS